MERTKGSVAKAAIRVQAAVRWAYTGAEKGDSRDASDSDTSSVRSGEWRQRPILVAGGGDMYLSAEYDPHAKVLLSFSANAQR